MCSRTPAPKVAANRALAQTPLQRYGHRIDLCMNPGAQQIRAWNEFVSTTAGSDVSQLSSWARLRATVGYAPLYIFATAGDRLIGGAQVLYRRFPLLGQVGYIPYGPIVAEESRHSDVCTSLGETIELLGRRRFRALFVRPPDDLHDLSADLLRRGFRQTDQNFLSNATLRLDLNASEDELRAKLNRRLRYWTDHWAARGVIVREGGLSDIALLSDLMEHTGCHQNYEPPPASYVYRLCHELMPGGHAVLFIGEANGVAVAADLLTMCGGIVKGRLTGFDRSGAGGRLSVPAAIRWHAIRWAKGAGYRWFDFGGISNRTCESMQSSGSRNSDTWPTTDRAKISFGGTPYRYPPLMELIRPAPLATFYDYSRDTDVGRRVVAWMQDTLRGAGRYRGRSRAHPLTPDL